MTPKKGKITHSENYPEMLMMIFDISIQNHDLGKTKSFNRQNYQRKTFYREGVNFLSQSRSAVLLSNLKNGV